MLHWMEIRTDSSDVFHQNIPNQLQIKKASYPRILQSYLQHSEIFRSHNTFSCVTGNFKRQCIIFLARAFEPSFLLNFQYRHQKWRINQINLTEVTSMLDTNFSLEYMLEERKKLRTKKIQDGNVLKKKKHRLQYALLI
jgi:hypothetical protein